VTRYTAWLVVVVMGGALAADETADPALIAHYRFAEGQGDMLLDHCGHQHHGRIVGARWERTGERWALRFDGSGDYVDFGDNRALKPTGDFTMLAWVTLDAPAYPDGTTNWSIFDCEAYPGRARSCAWTGPPPRCCFGPAVRARAPRSWESSALPTAAATCLAWCGAVSARELSWTG